MHSGLLEMRPALVTFGASLALAILALLLAFAGFVSIWKDGLHGMGASLGAIGIAILLLAYPTYIAVKARNLPWIYDITTDPIDPPRYDTLAKARPRDANPIVYAGLAAAEQQLEAYPDIEPLDADIDTRSAYNAALAVINRRRWRVVEARAPDQGRPEGRIEAVARTPIMGFRDDVIVRVRRVRGRRPRRRPLVVALRLVRFRRQCGARARPARRHRGRVRQPGAGRAAAGRASEGTGQGRAQERSRSRRRKPRRKAISPPPIGSGRRPTARLRSRPCRARPDPRDARAPTGRPPG